MPPPTEMMNLVSAYYSAALAEQRTKSLAGAATMKKEKPMPTMGATIPLSPNLIENGGLHVTFRAHAVCGNCTDFADFHGDPEALTLEQFGDAATCYFRGLGWKQLTRGKLADKFCCPTCSEWKV